MKNPLQNLSQTFKDHAVNVFAGFTSGLLTANLLTQLTEDNAVILGTVIVMTGAGSAIAGKLMSKEYKLWTNFFSMYAGAVVGIAIGISTGALDFQEEKLTSRTKIDNVYNSRFVV